MRRLRQRLHYHLETFCLRKKKHSNESQKMSILLLHLENCYVFSVKVFINDCCCAFRLTKVARKTYSEEFEERDVI